MANEGPAPRVIRRVKKGRRGHHGGSWKIAYADFVTAMMAFFLLMWLIGSTTKGDLEGIAEYFRTPLKVALQGGSGAGDSSIVIPGGGEDLTHATGQVKRSETPEERQLIDLQAARAALAMQERRQLENLKKRVEQAIDRNAELKQFRDQIRLAITAEGLQITVVDEQNRAMFDTGSAQLKDYMRELMRTIGGLLNDVDNAISIAGHTDAAPYALGDRGYSNWELSADRANASRRELIAGGMDERKVLRVVGLASSLPLDPEDPLNPINRRISLVVLNEKTERRIRGLPEEPVVEIGNPVQASGALGAGHAGGAATSGGPAGGRAPASATGH